MENGKKSDKKVKKKTLEENNFANLSFLFFLLAFFPVSAYFKLQAFPAFPVDLAAL